MRDLAKRTGGKAFFNSNDLAAAAEQAVELGSNYYTLTYVPSKTPARILAERSIKVEVARKDVTLFYRNKYPVGNPHEENQASHTPSPASAPSSAQADAAPVLRNAMRVAMIRGAPEPAQIAFLASARPTGTASEPVPTIKMSGGVEGPYQRYTVRILASVRNINCPADADGTRHCVLQFVTYIYDSVGTHLGNLVIPAKLAMPPARYNAALRDGIEFNQEISVPVEMPDCTLRVGILDVTSGRVGAVEFPVVEAAKLAPVSAIHP